MKMFKSRYALFIVLMLGSLMAGRLMADTSADQSETVGTTTIDSSEGASAPTESEPIYHPTTEDSSSSEDFSLDE